MSQETVDAARQSMRAEREQRHGAIREGF